MQILNALERRFGRLAIPNPTLILIVLQVGAFLLVQARPELAARIALVPQKVLAGEWWRLATFLAMPPCDSALFAAFFWYLFYLMGTALEQTWGTFRYNVYLLIGTLATVAASFLTPEHQASNVFLEGSVFLAFAFLYPDFELYIFFILPVKIKWLALLAWVGYAYTLLFGEWLYRLLVLASICNFLLFFSAEIGRRIKTGRRRMALQAAHHAAREKPYFHRCTVCGITDRTHPRMDFRYCSKCDGAQGYCMDHLHDHPHILAQNQPAAQ